MKQKALVISHQHQLLPVAWRLQREGYEVQVAQVFANKRRKRAWEGRFSSFLDGVKVDLKAAEAVVEAAREADAVVLTNSTRWTENFKGYPRLYGALAPAPDFNPIGRLTVGIWIAEGLTPIGEHLVFRDYGAWTNSMGPSVPAACLVAHDRGLAPALFDSAVAWVELNVPADFQGLAQVHLNETGEPTGATWGWPELHTQTWMGGLPHLLEGVGHEHGYVTGLVVSVPPWPYNPQDGDKYELPFQVPHEVTKHAAFHDVRIEADKLWTCGTDGLVAVVRGEANTPALASQRAVQRAATFQLPQAQFRTDPFTWIELALDSFRDVSLGLPDVADPDEATV